MTVKELGGRKLKIITEEPQEYTLDLEGVAAIWLTYSPSLYGVQINYKAGGSVKITHLSKEDIELIDTIFQGKSTGNAIDLYTILEIPPHQSHLFNDQCIPGFIRTSRYGALIPLQGELGSIEGWRIVAKEGAADFKMINEGSKSTNVLMELRRRAAA